MSRDAACPPPLVEVLDVHRTEIEFHYERRLPELSGLHGEWSEALRHEDAIERHLDGLALGGRRAFELCAQGLTAEAAPGEAFAAAALCVRVEAVAPKEALEAALTSAPPAFAVNEGLDAREALVDGLRFARGDAAEAWLRHLLTSSSAAVRAAAVRACAHRARLFGDVLRARADTDPAVALHATLIALSHGVVEGARTWPVEAFEFVPMRALCLEAAIRVDRARG